MAKWIKNEFWNGYTLFEKIFMIGLVALQLIMYAIMPDTLLGMVCGVAGVVCVVLTAKGKISSYIFNFIQMLTYMIICWEAKLYLEFGEQIFYFVACVFGVFLWKKNMSKNEDGTEQVKTKKFKLWHWIATIIVTILGTYLFGTFGHLILGSTLPYLDAFTVALSIIAQLLMIWRYREQWAVWILIDVASLVMFTMLGQWAMVIMYVAWTINAIYGWYNWSKLARG